MKKQPKAPDFLYITKKEEERVVNWDYGKSHQDQIKDTTILGFLHPHEPGKKTDSKRKETQFYWAYHTYCLEDNTDLILHNGRYVDGKYVVTHYPCPTHLLLVVWENLPLEGFRVVRSVSRMSTSNKVWRILDPRGVEFEISTGCFEDIIMNTTIVNGVIQGKCLWMSNKSLVVES
jgi:hypothetical protein